MYFLRYNFLISVEVITGICLLMSYSDVLLLNSLWYLSMATSRLTSVIIVSKSCVSDNSFILLHSDWMNHDPSTSCLEIEIFFCVRENG